MELRSHVRSLLPTWLVIGVGALVVVVTAILLQRAERANDSVRFEGMANTHLRLFERRLLQAQWTVASIAKVFELTPGLTRSEFRSMADGILTRQQSFQALQWVPLVPHEAREEFMESARMDGLTDFRIHNHTQQGQVEAPVAEHYLPITYNEPMEGNEAALGYNLLTSATSEYLQIAREQKRMVVSSPIRLIQEVGDQFAIIVIQPVFTGDQDDADLQGYVQAVFRIGNLLSMTLIEDAAEGVFLRVIAKDASGRTLEVFNNAKEDEKLLPWSHHHASIRIPLHSWDFYYTASNDWPGRSSGLSTWFAIFGLAGCAGALALHVQSTSNHHAKISRLVETRTAQLEKETIERLNRQERLAESEARYSVLYNLLPDSVLVVKSEVVQIMNDAARTLFQVAGSTNEAPIMFADLLRNLSDVEQIQKAVEEVLHCGNDFQIMHVPIQCEGQNMILNVRGEQVLWEGHPAVQLVFHDISAEVEAADRERDYQEKLSKSQRLESLGLMAGGVAHDFNNILTGILVNANLAREVVHDHPAAGQHIQEIEAASLRAADLCNSMLSYAGKNPKRKSIINLRDLVADTLKLIRASISSTTVIDFTPSPEGLLIAGDSAQLQQVIMNLIINAADAMGGKPGQLLLRVESVRYAVGEDDASQDFARLVITDNGKGMSSDILTRIFDPFYTTKPAGRGLGLSAVQGVVRSHEGHLAVESEEGIGTTFTLDFPLPRHVDLPTEKVTPAEPEKSFQPGGKILLAEDERLIRLVFETGLRKSGYEVTACPDGLAAVEEFEKDPGSYRLAIVDINMPRLNGHETIKRLHETRPDLPIAITSGFNEDNVAEIYINRPGFIFVQKPFQMKAFQEALIKLLGAEEPKR